MLHTTRDLYEAGYLLAKGHPITVVKFAAGGRTFCEFEFPPEAATDALAYERGTVLSAAMYADALRRLKGLVARAPLSSQPTEGAR